MTAPPLTGPTPSQKAAANSFWQRAAERTFSDGSEPAEAQPEAGASTPAASPTPPPAAAGAESGRPPRAAGRLRTGNRAKGERDCTLGLGIKHTAMWAKQ